MPRPRRLDRNAKPAAFFISSRAKRDFGYTDAEIGDDFPDWTRLFYPDDLVQCKAVLAGAPAARRPYYRNRTPPALQERRMEMDVRPGMVVERDVAGARCA